MTGQHHPIAMQTPVLTAWTPSEGIAECYAGREFDVVRARGLLALEAHVALIAATGNQPGPAIMENRSGDDAHVWVRFLVPSGDTRLRNWPPGIWVLRPGNEVAVPAFVGNTWPYSWLSRPTEGALLVDADTLFRVLCDLTGWRPGGGPTAARP